MNRVLAAAAAALLCGLSAVRADDQEIYSRFVRVANPKGDFAHRLIKLRPPEGSGWKEAGSAELGFRIQVPASAQVDSARQGTRALQVALTPDPARPRPVLRVDTFTPQPDEPDTVDAEYAADYAEEYAKQNAASRFALEESGLVSRDKKLTFAMVGGPYFQAAAPAYRVQWIYLAKDRQLVVTFDCAERDWEKYADTVALMLLSFTPGAGKR